MIHALLTLPLLTGCALPALPVTLAAPFDAVPPDAAPDVGPFAFEPAREDLALEATEPGGARTIGTLIEAYARCTGHVILFEPVVADSWRDAPVPAMTIPAARVQERVEQLLTLYGLTLRLQPGTSPRTVLVGTIEQPVGPAPFVELEALRLAGHRAPCLLGVRESEHPPSSLMQSWSSPSRLAPRAASRCGGLWASPS